MSNLQKKSNWKSFLSLFILISGILFFCVGLLLIFNTIDVVSVAVIIFGIILIFSGVMIPKSITSLDNSIKKEDQIILDKKKEIIRNLNNIRIATDDEKNEYINHRNIKTFISFPTVMVLALIAFFAIIFIAVGIFENAPFALTFFGFFLILIDICIFFRNKKKCTEKADEIMNNKIYIADCYVYDRKIFPVKITDSIFDTITTIDTYMVKITDGNYNIDKWFEIDSKDYFNEQITVKLYISEEITSVFSILVDN